MLGRRFLDLARDYLAGGTEVHWRGAVGRAYYALMLECRATLFRWGFKLVPRDNIHTFVRLRLNYPADPALKAIGLVLDKLSYLRNRADYDLATLPAFTSDAVAQDAVKEAGQKIAILDAIENDASRRSAAVAAIQKAFP
jgi:hypothetical protein